METKSFRNFLLFLLAFLGLGAIVGGGAMIISPSGILLGLPLSMLDKAPFNNYLIPGIILFLCLGLFPSIILFHLIKKTDCRMAEKFNFFKDIHWTLSYCIYIGFILIIWIQVEMVLIQTVSWIHTFYMFLAILIIFVSLIPQVRNIYKK